MTARKLHLLLAACALSACKRADDDFDGFRLDEDCDDADPFVYPGAADVPGDGIDSDCDGKDPEPDYLGTWVLTDFAASTFGIEFIVPGTSVGSFVVDPEMSATVDLSAALDPSIIGFELTISFAMQGPVSSLPEPNAMAFYAEGELYGEIVHFDWECVAGDDETLLCEGEVKALDSSLDAYALFGR